MNLKYKTVLLNFVIPLLLVLPIAWFTFPSVNSGAKDLRLLNHYDYDEAVLVEFGGRTYAKGIIPLEFQASYPQFFYYVAGIVLFPYTIMRGIDHHFIVVTFRCFNILIGALTVILLYFFVSRLFKSYLIGALSSFVFVTTPAYLPWLVNSRPHPLEILFILIALYFCLKMAVQYRLRYLTGAILFSGAATATKLGGLFLIPAIWVAYTYHSSQLPSSQLSDHSPKLKRTVFFVSLLLIICSIAVPVASILLYLKFPSQFYFLSIKTLNEFLQWRDFRLVLIFTVFLLVFGSSWLLINFFAKKSRLLFILNRSFLFLLFIAFCNFTMYILLNPSYLLYPIATAKAMVEHLFMSTMTSGLNPGFNKPVVDATGLLWLSKLFRDNLVLNGWFGLLFAGYLVYEAAKFRHNWSNSREQLLYRMLLLLYALILFLILFIFLAHQTHHYLLPIAMVICILTSYCIVSLINGLKNKVLRVSVAFFCFFILFFGFNTRWKSISVLYREAEVKTEVPDTALTIGNWLKANYGHSSKIWLDFPTFYIPGEYNNISSLEVNGVIEDEFNNIKINAPDILVITNRCDPELNNAKKIDQAITTGKLKGYHLEKEFEYFGLLAEKDVYKRIFIYIRK